MKGCHGRQFWDIEQDEHGGYTVRLNAHLAIHGVPALDGVRKILRRLEGDLSGVLPEWKNEDPEARMMRILEHPEQFSGPEVDWAIRASGSLK